MKLNERISVFVFSLLFCTALALFCFFHIVRIEWSVVWADDDEPAYMPMQRAPMPDLQVKPGLAVGTTIDQKNPTVHNICMYHVYKGS